MGAGHNAQRVGTLGVPNLAGPQLVLQVDHRAAVERERLPVVMVLGELPFTVRQQVVDLPRRVRKQHTIFYFLCLG